MDSKMREGDSLVDDNTAKKKFKFKSFKKFFGKKKRKESLPSLGSSVLKQSQSASDVTVPDSMRADYDSEDDIEATAVVLGSRAVSHDSIFIPEIVQETARPVRVFSQENVSDRIKELQLKLQSNIRVGPPPFGLLSKRTDDAGTSSEDDGLPRSPPEISLIHEAIKTRFSDSHRHHSSLSLAGTGSEEDDQVSSETSSRPLSPEENELRDAHKRSPKRSDSTTFSPSADFSSPPQFSTFLDNSAARHRLSIRPRNQRSSKIRRPSAALQKESFDNLACMEEEDVATPGLEQAAGSSVEAGTPDKSGDLVFHTDGGRNVTSKSPVTLEDNNEVSSEIVVGNEPQTLREVVQDRSPELNMVTTVTLQSENVLSATNVALDGKINVQEELVGRSSGRTSENSSCNLPTIEKEVYPILPLITNEKHLVRGNKVPGNERPSIAQEIVVPISRTAPLGHSQESLHIWRSHFQNSLSEKSQSITDQPLSDKENNNQVGNVDKSPTETGTQRKFSVSSAWERPRTGSFSFKATAEGDALKNIKLSLLKPGMSKTETLKEETKTAITCAENKPIGRKKETVADIEGMPVDKAVFSNITPNQSAVPAASDLSADTDLHRDTEDRNPFIGKLRSTSLSLRYRDSNNSISSTVKRHSAEFKQEKTGYLPFSKDEVNEAGLIDHSILSSKSEKLKCKADAIEAKPPLPKMPVLLNITIADNNTNKEASENGSNQEKKLQSSEAKAERKMFDRRPSLHKTIEKNAPHVAIAEPVKGAESKAQPAWMSMARQRQRSLKEEHSINEQRTVNQEAEKQNKERTEVNLKQQVDLIQNKATNTAIAALPETYGQDTKTEKRDQRPRANTLSHPVHATQLSLLTDKEEKMPHKRQTLSVSEEPSWMELAKKKSQAWSDMPQIIK